MTEEDIVRLNNQAHAKGSAAGMENMTIEEFWDWCEDNLTDDEGLAMLITMLKMQDAE